MSKPKLLDLFCKAGGAGRGYHDAGFDVVGVDIEPQKNYPFAFVQADALEYLAQFGKEYDAVHASPPCQFGSELTPMHCRRRHPNLIPAVRAGLRATGKPYIIENVAGVRRHLENPVMLCGSMFGLRVWRHRYFECPWKEFDFSLHCDHSTPPVVVSGRCRRGGKPIPEPTTEERREAMGIPWMTRTELDQAVPPAFTKFLGSQLLEAIK